MRRLLLLAVLSSPAAAQNELQTDPAAWNQTLSRSRRLQQAPQAFASPPAPRTAPLRALMASQGRWIGSAVQARLLEADPVYAKILASEFSMLTPENELKFAAVHGKGAESYDFSKADRIVAFAEANGMRVRGHTLAWYKNLPDWLTQGAYTPDQLSKILRAHIQAVAGRYGGKVYCWDVVNEAVLPDGSPRPSLWSSIGPDYFVKAFRWAHEADPSAKLFYNDQGLESSPAQADAVYNLLRDAKAAGAPIDGIGLQMHTWPGKAHGDLGALIRRFAALGLEVHITEMDVAVDAGATPKQLEAQASLYSDAAKACLSDPACKAFVMWGFTDKYTFLAPKLPLIFDAAYQPKPAYAALREALSSSSGAR